VTPIARLAVISPREGAGEACKMRQRSQLCVDLPPTNLGDFTDQCGHAEKCFADPASTVCRRSGGLTTGVRSTADHGRNYGHQAVPFSRPWADLSQIPFIQDLVPPCGRAVEGDLSSTRGRTSTAYQERVAIAVAPVRPPARGPLQDAASQACFRPQSQCACTDRRSAAV